MADHRLESAGTDHSQPGEQLGRVARYPPGALGEIDGETLQITKTRLMPNGPATKEPAPPGTVVRRDGERLVVQCGDGPIEILAWSPT